MLAKGRVDVAVEEVRGVIQHTRFNQAEKDKNTIGESKSDFNAAPYLFSSHPLSMLLPSLPISMCIHNHTLHYPLPALYRGIGWRRGWRNYSYRPGQPSPLYEDMDIANNTPFFSEVIWMFIYTYLYKLEIVYVLYTGLYGLMSLCIFVSGEVGWVWWGLAMGGLVALAVGWAIVSSLYARGGYVFAICNSLYAVLVRIGKILKVVKDRVAGACLVCQEEGYYAPFPTNYPHFSYTHPDAKTPLSIDPTAPTMQNNPQNAALSSPSPPSPSSSPPSPLQIDYQAILQAAGAGDSLTPEQRHAALLQAYKDRLGRMDIGSLKQQTMDDVYDISDSSVDTDDDE
eukprot:gene35465-42988_t